MKLTRKFPIAPIRIVHLGTGAFFKAHQAWYTAKADSNHEWGIAAFSGRDESSIRDLRNQGGIYNLIERSAVDEQITQIEAISQVFGGDQIDELINLLSKPEVCIVTITITEAGYRVKNDGSLDLEDQVVRSDLENLESSASPKSTLFRLARGLKARMLAAAGPISIVPCDNFPNNGEMVAKALTQIFEKFGPEASKWFEENVNFVSTSVDRITPKVTKEVIQHVRENYGIEDQSLVATESFSDWILEGSFPSGRPKWEVAGAKFVEDIKPFESRKLWLLNGAHSLIAYQGLLAGHKTVDEAMKNPDILTAVEYWWSEASVLLKNPELDLENYKIALLKRFNNPSLSHHLTQIAIDGATKLALRIAPVALQVSEPKASAHVISQWIKWVEQQDEIVDSKSKEILAAKNSPRELVALLSKELAESTFMNLVNKELDTTAV